MAAFSRESECLGLFGNPMTPSWGAEHLVHVTPPYAIQMGGVHVASIAINKIAADSLTRVLAKIAEGCHHNPAEIAAGHCDCFSGSYAARTKRGSSSISMHAYGLAIDWDAPHNPLGAPAGKTFFTPDSLLVRAFQEEGWEWGGNWHSRRDAMHVQAAYTGSPPVISTKPATTQPTKPVASKPKGRKSEDEVLQHFDQMCAKFAPLFREQLKITDDNDLAALFGNGGEESGGFTEMHQGGGGTAVGGWQFDGVLKQQYIAFCGQIGKPVEDMEASARFLIKLLKSSHKKFWAEVLAEHTLEAKTVTFRKRIERPDPRYAHDDVRYDLAKRALAVLTAQPGEKTVAEPTDSAASSELRDLFVALEKRLLAIETQLANSKGVPSIFTNAAESLEQKAFDVLNAKLQSLNLEDILKEELGKLNIGGFLQQQLGKLDLAGRLEAELTGLFTRKAA
jgi:hypothetical protein